MTKLKAFFIGFLIPIIAINVILVYIYYIPSPMGQNLGLGAANIFGLFYVIFLWFSVFILPLIIFIGPPFWLGKKYGIEFRKASLFGALTAIPFLMIAVTFIQTISK